jgi:hypothetical protein
VGAGRATRRGRSAAGLPHPVRRVAHLRPAPRDQPPLRGEPRRPGNRSRGSGGPGPADLPRVLLRVLRRGGDRCGPRPPLSDPGARAEGADLPQRRGPGGGHRGLVPRRRGSGPGRGAGDAPLPDAGSPGDEQPSRPAARPGRERRLFLPVHLGQHERAARRRPLPRQRAGHRQAHGRSGRHHRRGHRGELVAALPRHGAHRLLLHADRDRHPPGPPAPGPQEPAHLAGGAHRTPRSLHGGAGLRLPQLRPQRPRHRGAGPVEPPHGALGRGAGPAVDDSSLREPLRGQGRLLPRLWAGRGNAGRGHLAAGTARPARPHRDVRLRRPGLPGRPAGDRGRGRATRRPRRAGRRDPRAEPGRHGALPPGSGGDGPGAAGWLAPHRRSRLPRRRGLPLRHGTDQGRHHRRRAERGAGRHRGDRGRASVDPLLGGDRAGERADRHAAPPRGGRGTERDGPGRGAVAAGAGDRGRDPPPARRPAGPGDPGAPPGDPEDIERQDPARQPRRAARGRRVEREGARS